MKICYVHNVIMPYKLPLLTALERIQGVTVSAIGGRSHWRGSKFDRALRSHPSPNVRSIPTLDLLLPSRRGRTLHLFLSPFLGRALDEEDPDLVVGGIGNVLNNPLLWRWSERRAVPYLWHGIGSLYEDVTLLRRLADPIVQRFVDRAAGGWAFNRVSKEYYVRRYGLPPDRVAVVPNIVHDEGIRERAQASEPGGREVPTSSGLHVLFVGHLVPAKRVGRLIEAVGHVRSTGRDVHLTIVGDGPSRSELERMAESLPKGLVTFRGARFEDVHRFFQSADIFVLPGSGGLAIHEAMCYGLPVICTGADGSGRDLVEDARSGFLLVDGTVSEIASRISDLVDDPGLRRAMGERALSLVHDRFSIEAVSRSVSEILSSWGLLRDTTVS